MQATNPKSKNYLSYLIVSYFSVHSSCIHWLWCLEEVEPHRGMNIWQRRSFISWQARNRVRKRLEINPSKSHFNDLILLNKPHLLNFLTLPKYYQLENRISTHDSGMSNSSNHNKYTTYTRAKLTSLKDRANIPLMANISYFTDAGMKCYNQSFLEKGGIISAVVPEAEESSW